MSDPAMTFSCSGCGNSYKWKPELAGKRVKCKCGTPIEVPKEIAPPEPVDDMYDLAPTDEPPKRVKKVTVAAPTEQRAMPAMSGGGAAVAAPAAPVLGYKSGPTKREKERFSTETFIDMKRDAYVPIVLLVVGLAMSVAYYAIHYRLGMTGIAITTLGVGVMTAFKAVLLIGFALVIAGPIGVSFGGIWTAVLKLAAIAVFSDGATTWVDAGLGKLGAGGLATIITFPVSIGIYWMLLITLFSMDPGDSWLVVMLLSVFDNIVRWAIILLLLNAVMSLSGVVTATPGATASSGNMMAAHIQELQDEGYLREAHEYYTTQNHVAQLREQCEGWYAAGVQHVWYEVSSDINGHLTVQLIHVELPEDKTKRAACYKILNDYRVYMAKAWNVPPPSPEVDKGDPYMEVGVPHSY